MREQPSRNPTSQTGTSIGRFSLACCVRSRRSDVVALVRSSQWQVAERSGALVSEMGDRKLPLSCVLCDGELPNGTM